MAVKDKQEIGRVELSRSIKDGETEVTEIVIREPMVKDLIAAESATGEVGQTVALLASCASVTPSAIATMTAADYYRAVAILQPFLLSALQEGGTSSQS